MASALRKLNDLSSRWVTRMVWIQDGYWQPDPVDPVDPYDPIDEGEPTVNFYGYYTSVKTFPNPPSGAQISFGRVPQGYVERGSIYFFALFWWEPA